MYTNFARLMLCETDFTQYWSRSAQLRFKAQTTFNIRRRLTWLFSLWCKDVVCRQMHHAVRDSHNIVMHSCRVELKTRPLNERSRCVQ